MRKHIISILKFYVHDMIRTTGMLLQFQKRTAIIIQKSEYTQIVTLSRVT